MSLASYLVTVAGPIILSPLGGKRVQFVLFCAIVKGVNVALPFLEEVDACLAFPRIASAESPPV